MYDAPGRRLKKVAVRALVDGQACVVDNTVGFAFKSEVLTRFVDPETAAATAIAVGEEFVMFQGGIHELALSGGLSGVSEGDKLYIQPADDSVVTAPDSGTAEVQEVTVDATAGNYTLEFDGEVTDNIAFNATAAAVETALEGLSNIQPGDVVVTGGPGDAGGTTPYVVTFGGQYEGTDVPEMVATDVDLTGGGDAVTVSTTTEGGAGDTAFPLGVVDEIDTSRDPDVARINTDAWQAFAREAA